jgi:hypothetical protein
VARSSPPRLISREQIGGLPLSGPGFGCRCVQTTRYPQVRALLSLLVVVRLSTRRKPSTPLSETHSGT